GSHPAIDSTTGVLYQNVPDYGCAPCGKRSFREPDGKACLSCWDGQGVFDLFGAYTCLPCESGQGTRDDGTCGTCSTPVEGLVPGIGGGLICMNCPYGFAAPDGTCGCYATGQTLKVDFTASPPVATCQCGDPSQGAYQAKCQNCPTTCEAS